MTAPYRDDLDALSARHEALSEELASLRARLREAEGLQQQEARLAAEVAALEAKLVGARPRRALPLLETVRIASPCTASWEAMQGDERVRFCGQCQKNVYNLSGMARAEAEALLRERSTEICVRLYQRRDGTVLTADCPVGLRRKRRRRLVAATAAAIGSSLAAYGLLHHEEPTMGAVRMGETAYDEPTPPAPPTPEATPPAADPDRVVMGVVPIPLAEATPPKVELKGKPLPPRPLMGKPQLAAPVPPPKPAGAPRR